jgi:[acyl-carrier-protein] S-malonyltransferase
MELCKAAGARRVMKLPVAGAFHTPLMAGAAAQFKAALAAAELRRARVPVYVNVSGEAVQEPDDFRLALERQLTSPVRWEQTIQNLLARGHTWFVELGVGRTLTNMIRRIAPEARAQAVGTWEEVKAFAKER